jgi:2-dehydro-3-deoxy-D-arabinonate dehydratase
MQLARFLNPTGGAPAVGVVRDGRLRPLGPGAEGLRLADLLHGPDAGAQADGLVDEASPGYALDEVPLLAPIDAQEVWGAGVTYLRSKVAREAESESAASFYDRIYSADRPELFFKASPSRVVGPGEAIRVRADSAWTVPEPELGLVLSPELRIVGLTIGNDVSARDIEGRNPLYLPQAKVYDACCALGPVVTLPAAGRPPDDLGIRLEIERGGATAFEGETSTARMARKFDELVAWLGRDSRFPDGVILLTGTGIVPPDDFGLKAGDVVRITIEGIGTLANPVVGGPSQA